MPEQHQWNQQTQNLARQEAIPSDQVKSCKFCNAPIVWLESKKSGKKYVVDVPEDYSPNDEFAYVLRNKFHNCPQREEAMNR